MFSAACSAGFVEFGDQRLGEFHVARCVWRCWVDSEAGTVVHSVVSGAAYLAQDRSPESQPRPGGPDNINFEKLQRAAGRADSQPISWCPMAQYWSELCWPPHRSPSLPPAAQPLLPCPALQRRRSLSCQLCRSCRAGQDAAPARRARPRWTRFRRDNYQVAALAAAGRPHQMAHKK